MSVYPSPKQHNGSLNQTFNRDDYVIQNTGGGASLAQSDARYLQNSGSIVSSAVTTFNSTVNIKGLASIDTIVSKQTVNTLVSGVWSAVQSYSFKSGTVYSLASNATALTSLAITDLPTTPLQTYTFTFIIEPSVKSSPFYLNSNGISINSAVIPLSGISNVALPTIYTYIIQTVSIVNRSSTIIPAFIAYTSVSGYQSDVKKQILIAGGGVSTPIAYSEYNGVSWVVSTNQPFTQQGYTCGFDGSRVVMGGNANIAYSDDYGKTWVATGFTTFTTVLEIKYFSKSKIWLAGGRNTTTNLDAMATSIDGINWNLISNQLFSRCYSIIYNGSVYIATGFDKNSQYPMATSTDAVNWTLNTTFIPDSSNKIGYCLFFDGNRYIFGGEAVRNVPGRGNIATSPDGITWDNTQNSNLPFDVKSIAYNGLNTYVAVGSKNGFIAGTIFYYWSNDLINWTAGSNTLLVNCLSVVWDGKNFTVTGNPISGSTTTIIYSADGKTWTASSSQPFANGNGLTGIS